MSESETREPRGTARSGRGSADAGAELRAALEARRELGPEYEPAIVEGFVERLDQVIDARLAERTRAAEPAKQQGIDGSRLALAIVSVGVGIPLTAITLIGGQSMIAMLIVWVAIVLVNVVAGIRR